MSLIEYNKNDSQRLNSSVIASSLVAGRLPILEKMEQKLQVFQACTVQRRLLAIGFCVVCCVLCVVV